MSSSAAEHIPVLANELAEHVNLPPDGVMVDATIGQGGHSLLFGRQLTAAGLLVGMDVDEESLQQAGQRLKGLSCRVVLIRSNFADIVNQLHIHEIEKADFILADLGVSSRQLADEQIGLSFQSDMPLDMRLDKSLTTTAADIVNKTPEKSLADLIYSFAQERASRRIARFIAEYRRSRPIMTTAQLAAIVCRALHRPGRKTRHRIHPATRTFQALRIAVNNELENLRNLLDAVPDLLSKAGSIAVISFHSLEDRLVKLNFKENADRNVYEIVTKKPLVASTEQLRENPRARSAKLRIARKT